LLNRPPVPWNMVEFDKCRPSRQLAVGRLAIYSVSTATNETKNVSAKAYADDMQRNGRTKETTAPRRMRPSDAFLWPINHTLWTQLTRATMRLLSGPILHFITIPCVCSLLFEWEDGSKLPCRLLIEKLTSCNRVWAAKRCTVVDIYAKYTNTIPQSCLIGRCCCTCSSLVVRVRLNLMPTETD
jgi:hypothetical protein